MRKTVLSLILFGVLGLLLGTSNVEAASQSKKLSPTVTEAISPTVTIEPTAVPEAKPNITEPQTQKVEYTVGKWNGLNSVRWVVKWAIDRGVATNTIVLLLLLPLIATLVSVLHYIFGFTGYGIFMPTMIAIAFLATGIAGGLLLFALILLISICSNLILKKFKIHFWPARAISLLFISLGTFGLMIFSSFVKIVDITQISIFPVLFMILLAEEFTRTQLVKSRKEAKNLMTGTLILAVFGAFAMNMAWVQNIVLHNPEILILLVLVTNLVVGNYTGIRLSEIQRFKKAIREK